MPGPFVVAHPSRILVSYQTALALQEAGLLNRYETGFYYNSQGILPSIIRGLPPSFRNRMQKELGRREQAGLDISYVRGRIGLDVLHTIGQRIGLPDCILESMMNRRNEQFDASVARGLLKDQPKAVIAYDTAALKTFHACKQIGAIRILDQVIGHIRTGARLLREECHLQPDFADTISMSDTTAMESRCTAEALAADWVLAPSEYVRETLMDIGVPSARIMVLPYGADVQRFEPAPKIPGHPFRILFVGQIGQRKGIKYLLEAFKNLHLPDCELILMGTIAGSGKGLRPYEGLFKHIPSVPYSELHRYYNAADIFVYPSLHEGSPLAVYEAMASGLPVVTTPNAGSVVRDGEEGFIVRIRDVGALMTAILTLYRNKDLRTIMGQKARKRAASFTWQNYRRNLGLFAHRLMGGP